MPFTLISDFTGTDENPLSEGGNWAKLNSSGNALQRVSNAVTSALSFGDSYWTPANFGPDLEAYVTLVTTSSATNTLLLRIQQEGGAATWDGYGFRSSSSSSSIQRITNGSAVALITTTAVVYASGDKLGGRCAGSTLQLWRQASGSSVWDLVVTVVDATWASAGKIGFQAGNTTTRVDDFYVADPLEYLFGGGVQQVPAVPFM